uniref:Peptidase A1 domain-containing protein n=1 Tax=Oryza barthii TaxID=65489 RepID=A0A0D3GRT5_9ORYZ
MVATGDAAAVGKQLRAGSEGGAAGERRAGSPAAATHEAHDHEAAWAASSSATPLRRAGSFPLVTQLRGEASLGRRFSYCLVPHSVNTSSAFNFGTLANVTELGAASTPLVAGDVDTYYTVVLDFVKVGNKTVASAASSRIIVDSGTMLTFLDPDLMGPLIDELSRRITLPPMQSPDGLLQLCYEVAGREVEAGERITNHIDKHLYSTVESCSDNQTSRKQTEQVRPDLTLEFGSGGGGAAAALKPENVCVMGQEGTLCLEMATLCLAIVATTEQQTVSILGNLA